MKFKALEGLELSKIQNELLVKMGCYLSWVLKMWQKKKEQGSRKK